MLFRWPFAARSRLRRTALRAIAICKSSKQSTSLQKGKCRSLFRIDSSRCLSMGAEKKNDRQKTGRAASIYDVARESGVSVFTVSAVVNNKSHVRKGLREKVQRAIRKLNYRPNLLARSLAKQKTHTIGMIVPDISNPFFPLVVRGAEDAAQKQGYNLLLCNSDDIQVKEENALELLLSKRVDGILLTKAASEISPWLSQMIQEV